MAAKVLLVHPTYGEETENRIFRPGIEFPLSLACLSSFIEQSGISCDLLDMRLKGHNGSVLARYLHEHRPVAVGLTASTANITNADRLARAIKAISPETTTVIGGWHASALPEQTLKQHRAFDCLVHGEGERAFTDLVTALAERASPRNCQGIAYRDDGHVVVNPRPPLIDKLDELPPPARDKLPITAYRPSPGTRNYRRLPSTGILVGRGCPYQCLFCYKGVWGRSVRVRSPEGVFAEIQSCVERYGIRDFRFYDDTVTSRCWDLEKLCALITERGVDISWNCWSRVNDVDLAKLRMMKEAGCYHIKFGIEFGTEKALKLTRKGATLDQARQAIDLCKRVGIECKGSFIFGVPFEKKEDCARTIEFAKALSPDFATFYPFDPIPGSPYYVKLAAREIDEVRDMLSTAERQSLADQAYKSFYLRPTFFAQRLKALVLHPYRELSMLASGLGMVLSYLYSRLASKVAAQRRPTAAGTESASPILASAGDAIQRTAAWSTALLAMIATAPIMLLIALAIKLDSPGPALFRQVRVGANRRKNNLPWPDNGNRPERRTNDLGGRPFLFYKFRTMYADARQRFPELYEYLYTDSQIAGMYFKRPDDPRLTPFGKRLRRTTLDELPNFFNVLKGDMNLVGPRPDIPEMVRYYQDWQRTKLAVKPGITGLSQIGGRGLLSFQETLRLDVKYVKSRSLWLDLKILLKTLGRTGLRIGAF